MLGEPFSERKQKSGQRGREREKIHVENEYDDCRMNGNFKGYRKHDLHKIIRKNNYSLKRHGAHKHTDNMESILFLSLPLFRWSGPSCSLHKFQYCRERERTKGQRKRGESSFNTKVTNNVMWKSLRTGEIAIYSLDLVCVRFGIRHSTGSEAFDTAKLFEKK